MNKNISEKILKRKELFEKGLTVKEIAEKENVTTSAIINSLNKAGIRIRRKLSNDNISKEIYDYFKKGITLDELSSKYNVSKNVITYHIKKFENVNFSKNFLDNKERNDKVIKMYKEGYSMYMIGKVMKCPNYVSKILKAYGIEYKNKSQFRKKHIDENIFNKIDTQEKAYWLGMLYADGYITLYHKKGQRYTVELCLKDKEHIEKFIDFLGDKEYKPVKKIVKLNGKEFTHWRYAVYSKQLSTDLVKHGCLENKSLILKFPDENILSKDLIPHFIRGYTDGDGSIGESKGKMFFCLLGTKNFLDKVIEIFLKNNLILSKPTYQMSGKAYSFIRIGKQVKKIMNFLHPENTTIHLERKYQKYAVLLGEE